MTQEAAKSKLPILNLLPLTMVRTWASNILCVQNLISKIHGCFLVKHLKMLLQESILLIMEILPVSVNTIDTEIVAMRAKY
ncbi:hypothetical protein F2Q68_00026461 [Brassica cretica]|uniref:Uncharacterized protein n=1 Tax=Brassica cretica TaxID=69181 RepID=A0A8S9IBR5_BRACR|nr:hypothetical protein F2Q68_00026461 [Brassica cretica]